MMRKIMVMAMLFMAIFVMAQNQGPSPCSSTQAHEFDFWIGNWTVYKTGTDKVVGYNSITIAGGCGIQESWKSADGNNIGTSLNKYAFQKGKWQQFWIDNSGLTLELEGNYADNKMVMTGQTPNSLERITWFNNIDGTVRQLWEQSKDSGTNWTVAFDGLYKKQK